MVVQIMTGGNDQRLHINRPVTVVDELNELEWICKCVEMTHLSIVNCQYQVWIPVAAKDELEWICACERPENYW